MRKWALDFTGAFADGAVLFPLLAALSLQSGYSATMLLLSAGLAYLASGYWFKVPMPVQPLKSIAIAAIAIGASFSEIRLSGAILGVSCLLLALLDVDRWGSRVPRSLVHGLQAGLGIILIRQGLKFGMADGILQVQTLIVAALVAGMLVLPRYIEFPVLGLVATGGVLWALATGISHPLARAVLPSSPAALQLRPLLVLGLVFPQLALTLGNSVLGTQDVAQRYFGMRARRVSFRRLLRSIGVGNVLSAAVGGLPYCHGAGGMTAHVRGGATHWRSNAIIGCSLLVFAAIQGWNGKLQLAYPIPLMAALLVCTGFFHLGLAAPTWRIMTRRAELLVMGLTAAVTQNMLGVLAAGALFEVLLSLQQRSWRSLLKTRGIS